MTLVIEVKVIPSSGKQQCTTDKSGTIKCYLKSAPEGGKANAELIKFLSKQLKVSQKQITILTGTTSRKKRIKIDAKLSRELFCKQMGIFLQQTII